jgi:hypothetical protein
MIATSHKNRHGDNYRHLTAQDATSTSNKHGDNYTPMIGDNYTHKPPQSLAFPATTPPAAANPERHLGLSSHSGKTPHPPAAPSRPNPPSWCQRALKTSQ